jgi:hypothetical protein
MPFGRFSFSIPIDPIVVQQTEQPYPTIVQQWMRNHSDRQTDGKGDLVSL